jgi:tRNA modification GTPase
LLLVDAQTSDESEAEKLWPDFVHQLPNKNMITVIRNKADLSGEEIGLSETEQGTVLRLSAKSGDGLDMLKQHLKSVMGYEAASEGGFIARRRHIEALEKAQEFVDAGQLQLREAAAGELLAEDLRHAQNALNEITGEFTPDDLLGRIFSSFCIGK